MVARIMILPGGSNLVQIKLHVVCSKSMPQHRSTSIMGLASELHQPYAVPRRLRFHLKRRLSPYCISQALVVALIEAVQCWKFAIVFL